MKDEIEKAKVKAERKAARKAAKKANAKWLAQFREAKLLQDGTEILFGRRQPITCPPPPITWGKHTSMREIAKSSGRGPTLPKSKTA